MTEESNKVVLAYSGGLDSTALVCLLFEHYGFREVYPVLVDVGQGEEDIAIAKERAKKLGVKVTFFDAKKEFVTDYIHRCIKANGSYQGYPVGTSMSRILIASKVAKVARERGADAVAHGCTGKGNDQYRMEAAFRYYAGDIRVVAPVRELNLIRSKEEEILRSHGIDPAKKVGKIGGDINVWSHSIGRGPMEDLRSTVTSDYLWAVPPEEAPDRPTEITVDFKEGVPIAIDGVKEPYKMLDHLNVVGGRNGVGRIDILEDGILGLKSREIYEAPAAEILLKAHADLEHLTLTKEQLRLKREVDLLWADMVYHGMWLHPLKRDLDAFVDSTQKHVNGSYKLRLYKGRCDIVERSSEDSLFAPELRSIKKEGFDQAEATGSVNMYTMPYKLYRMKGR
ncbi:MAG: argininosuccinate synthase [Candidatus Bathyarchaeia archaeon]